MHPKTHIYPHFYTPYEVLINMYPRKYQVYIIGSSIQVCVIIQTSQNTYVLTGTFFARYRKWQ